MSKNIEKKAARETTGIRDLLDKARQYLPSEALKPIEDAYEYVSKAHAEDVEHAIHTAIAATELQLNEQCIAAALLHEIPTHDSAALNEIRAKFGPEVTKLVEGVIRLATITWAEGRSSKKGTTDADTHTEGLRRMLIAISEDIRVVFIKLGCRLQKMQILDQMPKEKQIAVATDTMAIYAPIAHRLGIWGIKWQLEDKAFAALEPEKYREVEKRITDSRSKREQYINQVIQTLQKELKDAGIEAEITGRPKHFYGISQKMERYEAQGKDFSDIYDLSGIRILVNDIKDCYNALGVIHSHYRPLPSEFNDYIVQPKGGVYQSLHTTVMFMHTTPLEIQIRTREMHHVAEYGIAAHWRYKEGSKEDKVFEKRLSALRELLDLHKDVGGTEFLESIVADVFSDLVLVYTPKGDIKDLPAGSTPLDFAYHVHTDMGHRCIGAKVNRKIVPLTYKLQSGDTVEIMTAKGDKGPSRDWLNPALGYLKTSHAREKVRQWFRKQERSENIQRGRELLEKELRRLGISSSEEELANLFEKGNVEDFLAAIGSGDISTHQIASRLSVPKEKLVPEVAPKRKKSPTGIQVMGVEDMLTHLAPCCNPLPGDKIIGYVTRTKGVSVHRTDCLNIVNIDEKERLIRVAWEPKDQMYTVPVRIETMDRVGLLRDISAVIAEEGVNITAASTSNNSVEASIILLTLETKGLGQLSQLLSKLEGVRGVINVTRLT